LYLYIRWVSRVLKFIDGVLRALWSTFHTKHRPRTSYLRPYWWKKSCYITKSPKDEHEKMTRDERRETPTWDFRQFDLIKPFQGVLMGFVECNLFMYIARGKFPLILHYALQKKRQWEGKLWNFLKKILQSRERPRSNKGSPCQILE